MKKLLFVLSLVFMFIACGGSSEKKLRKKFLLLELMPNILHLNI
ncbi:MULTISPECIES: hypothetical protein [Fusobacterium]|nr:MULTISPECIES: hypothetical protein [Fusobacterium]